MKKNKEHLLGRARSTHLEPPWSTLLRETLVLAEADLAGTFKKLLKEWVGLGARLSVGHPFTVFALFVDVTVRRPPENLEEELRKLHRCLCDTFDRDVFHTALSMLRDPAF